jgi:hypothetical protein
MRFISAGPGVLLGAIGAVEHMAQCAIIHLAAPSRFPLFLYRSVISPTHKRTEGRAPVWGSEFTTKGAQYRGDSAEKAAGLMRRDFNSPLWNSWAYQEQPPAHFEFR